MADGAYPLGQINQRFELLCICTKDQSRHGRNIPESVLHIKAHRRAELRRVAGEGLRFRPHRSLKFRGVATMESF